MNIWFLTVSFLITLCSACNFTKFTMRSREVDKLPATLPAGAVKLAAPAFSMYYMSDGLEKEYDLSMPAAKEQVKNILQQQVFQGRLPQGAVFSGSSGCVENKMNPNNLRDTSWYRPETFACMNLDTGFYHIITYTTFEAGENVSYSARPMNDHINIYVLVHVLKNGRILYSKRVRKLMRMTNSDERRSLTHTVSAYFTEERIRDAVVKATASLAKRIKQQ